MGPIRFLPLALAGALLAGCANQFSPAINDRDLLITSLESQYSGNAYTADITAADDSAERNAMIAGRLALIDTRYYQFTEQLLANQQRRNLAFDVSGIAFGLIGATGGESTAQTMSALSGGLTSARASVDKNLLMERTLGAIVTAMNAARAEALAPILAGMGADIRTYPTLRAVADLAAYEHAGTLVAGIDTLQAAAAEQAATAEEQLRVYDLTDASLDQLDDLRAAVRDLCSAQVTALLGNEEFLETVRARLGSGAQRLEPERLAATRAEDEAGQRQGLDNILSGLIPNAQNIEAVGAHVTLAQGRC